MQNAELKERYALNYKLRGTEMYREAYVYVLRSFIIRVADPIILHSAFCIKKRSPRGDLFIHL